MHDMAFFKPYQPEILNCTTGFLNIKRIVGESGHKARPMNEEWALNIKRSCKINKVPFFFKQWGAHNADGERVGKKEAGRILAGRTWNEVPFSV